MELKHMSWSYKDSSVELLRSPQQENYKITIHLQGSILNDLNLITQKRYKKILEQEHTKMKLNTSYPMMAGINSFGT